MEEELREILRKVLGSREYYPEISIDVFLQYWTNRILDTMGRKSDVV